ncbi:MAG: hypothetical protein P8130_07965, partial [Deltaproteobacteria bacterium]
YLFFAMTGVAAGRTFLAVDALLVAFLAEAVTHAQCHEAPNFPKGVAFDAWTMSMGHGFCKECHKKGVDGKKGPTSCNACHSKK